MNNRNFADFVELANKQQYVLYLLVYWSIGLLCFAATAEARIKEMFEVFESIEPTLSLEIELWILSGICLTEAEHIFIDL